jgi:hypothetical protein
MQNGSKKLRSVVSVLYFKENYFMLHEVFLCYKWLTIIITLKKFTQ